MGHDNSAVHVGADSCDDSPGEVVHEHHVSDMTYRLMYRVGR